MPLNLSWKEYSNISTLEYEINVPAGINMPAGTFYKKINMPAGKFDKIPLNWAYCILKSLIFGNF